MSFASSSLKEASKLMEASILIDKIDIYTVGEPVTVGFKTEKPLRLLDPLLMGYPALVQATTLNNATESAVENTYSIKVALGVGLKPGMVVEVTRCVQDPSLVGKRLLVDKISENGAALIRKAVAHDYHIVNQEGM